MLYPLGILLTRISQTSAAIIGQLFFAVLVILHYFGANMCLCDWSHSERGIDAKLAFFFNLQTGFMNLTDPSAMLWALLFSSIGLGYFVYGKRQANKVALYSGLALMLYSYFFNNVYALIAIGVSLMLLPKYVKL